LDLEPLRIDRSSQPPRRGGGGGLPVLRLALVAGLILLSWLFREPLMRVADRLRLPEVRVVLVRKSSARASAAATGTAANGYIVAEKRAALSADTPGRIVEMLVTEGSRVKAGQVVARLYADEFEASLRRSEADLEAARVTVGRREVELEVARADLLRAKDRRTTAEANIEEARASLRLAEQMVERSEKLSTDNVQSIQMLDSDVAERDQALAREKATIAALSVAGREIQRAELQVRVAENAVEEARAAIVVRASERDLARATLDKMEVRAPFDGIVVLKDAEVGEVVSPNSQGAQSRGSVCTIVDPATLEVQVDMPETSLSAVVVGAPARIFLDAFPDKPYRGRVKRIWPTANRQKATVEVRIGFEASDEDLRPDLGARVVFGAGLEEDETEEPREPRETGQRRILVPEECVVRLQGRSGVFVLERDVVTWRELGIGESQGGRVLVLSGLEGGERIVFAPPPSLEDGDRVRPLEE